MEKNCTALNEHAFAICIQVYDGANIFFLQHFDVINRIIVMYFSSNVWLQWNVLHSVV